MFPKERVYTALAHREPDRVPWGELAIDYDSIENLLGRKTFHRAKFRETQALWEGRRDEVVASYKRDIVDVARALELDIVTVMLAPAKDHHPTPYKKIDEQTYEDEHGNLYRVSATTHNLMPFKRNKAAYREPRMEELEAALAAPPEPKPSDDRWEIIRHVVREMGDTHFIAARAPDIGWPHVGADQEEALINMVEKPELVRMVAKLNAKRAIESVDWFRGEGIDALFVGADYAGNLGPLASPRLFEELCLPGICEQVRRAHEAGFKVLKHACGNNWLLMDYFCQAGYDAYQAIQTSAGMDLKKLKERYGDRITLWGGVTTENLILGSPEDVRCDALYALRHAAPGGGFIYGASHSIAVGTKFENLIMMKRMRDEKGAYPIRL